MFENIDDDSPHAVKLKLEKYANMQSSGTIYYDLKSLLDWEKHMSVRHY